MTSLVTSKSVVVSGYDSSDIINCERSKTRSGSNLPTECGSWTKPTKSSQRSASKRNQATVIVFEDDHTTQANADVDVDENTDFHSEIIEIKITEEKRTVQNEVNNREQIRKKKKDVTPEIDATIRTRGRALRSRDATAKNQRLGQDLQKIYRQPGSCGSRPDSDPNFVSDSECSSLTVFDTTPRKDDCASANDSGETETVVETKDDEEESSEETAQPKTKLSSQTSGIHAQFSPSVLQQMSSAFVRLSKDDQINSAAVSQQQHHQPQNNNIAHDIDEHLELRLDSSASASPTQSPQKEKLDTSLLTDSMQNEIQSQLDVAAPSATLNRGSKQIRHIFCFDMILLFELF